MLTTKDETLGLDRCESILFVYYQAFKGRLLNGLIHNIGSPLQSLVFFLEFLEIESPKTFQSQFRDVSSQLGSIISYFDDFRYFDKMAHSPEMNLDIYGFYQLFSKILKADLFFKHSVSLEIQSSVGITLLEMPSKVFVLIFVELVNNALKALRKVEGEKKLIFKLNVTESKNSIIVGVGDSGCGWDVSLDSSTFFKPSYSFWPFFDTKVSEIPSFGMGLFCVKKLLVEYGGSISLTRSSEGMSWVELILPVRDVFI
ncbi:MAG: ATP-binding protein [Syntrophobacterales bacterium]|nr:ATP-binding protein [Syntrophobacterales bacterium]